MRFRLTFKTADVLEPILEQYMECEEHNERDPECQRCRCSEGGDLSEEYCLGKMAAIQKVADKFIKYGECITIEFDTDTSTAVVVPL